MTGPLGNRLSICPLKFSITPQKNLLTSAAPQSIETLGEAILNLSGQIDLPITMRSVIICLILSDHLLILTVS